MDPLELIKIQNLMKITKGDPNITIGLIDGPVDLGHPAFEGSKIKTVTESHFAECKSADSLSCQHGTFIAGILCSKRGLPAPGICSGCTLLLRPIFLDKTISNNIANKYDDEKDPYIDNYGVYHPSTTPNDLYDAMVEVIDKGAKIINLSLGLSTSSLTLYTKLQEAYDYARKKGAIIVAAAGNHGNIGGLSLIENDWVIPVAACDENGQLSSMSNIAHSITSRGMMAPGINITSAFPDKQNRYAKLSGTSFAVPFVTGAIALLWSAFPYLSAAQLIYLLRYSYFSKKKRSIIPRLLDVQSICNIIQNKNPKDIS
jgi:subtilisin family serine protease